MSPLTDTPFPSTTPFRPHLGAYARARAVFLHFDRARALGVQSGPVAGGPAGRRPQRRRLLWAAGMAACLCVVATRSEEHTSELQSLMRISYAVFCLKKKISKNNIVRVLHSHSTIEQ